MNQHEFLTSVTATDVILTANQRLALYLQRHYEAQQIQLGAKAWPSLQILPLQSWIETVWEADSKDPRQLLSDNQELLLWQNCIATSKLASTLLNLTETARLAKDSWRLLNQWLLKPEDIADSPSSDVQTFLSWVITFQTKCEKENYLSRAIVLNNFIDRLASQYNPFRIPTKLFLVGFDELSPAIKMLYQVLKQHSDVEIIQFAQNKNTKTARTSFQDAETEFREMARWAYQCLLNNKKAVIGCVIPDLAQKRNQIVRIFADVFYAADLQESFSTAPFNISAAENLNQFPIIQVALIILGLNFSEVKLADISCLLRTPFINGGEFELNERARLDVGLRILGEKKFSFRSLVSSNFFNRSCKILHSCLQNFLALATDDQTKKTLNDWAFIFSKQLYEMGWPGDRSLTSTEYQLLEKFKKLLDEFASLAEFVKEVTFQQAYSTLQQLIGSTLFQPKSHNSTIQILGILEASGIAFDYLWVAGLDNETWPAPCSPNPFIPFSLQKKYEMPHATCERELQFSLGVTQRFLQNANEIIFSHAEYDNDRPLSPSPLIAQFPVVNFDCGEISTIEKIIFQTKNLEIFADDLGPVIEREITSGGSGIFKSQAACPFQAFAKFRLQAQPLNEVEIGLAPHERGSLVHDILAKFWSQIHTQEALLAYAEDELVAICEQTIDSALHKIKIKKPFMLKNALFSLEKQRLTKLILDWLRIEKSRPPFTVIGCEQKQTAKIGNLVFNVQIDRIDQLEDGSHLIIDYKTGKASVADWFSDRPNEPQLPLYTLVSPLLLTGILFAQIRAGEMLFKGLTAFEKIVPGGVTIDRIRDQEFEDWESVMVYWQKTLHQLAEDFCQGIAKVAPKAKSTCQFCQLHQLCRVKHQHAF